MDLYTTFATIAGGDVPEDRIIDGVDQAAFFLGEQERSNRESVVIYVGDELYGVKWRNWKIVANELDKGFASPVKSFEIPLFYNLHLDPKEEYPMQRAEENLWVRYPASEVVLQHVISLQKEPPIPPGTPDPYLPKPGK